MSNQEETYYGYCMISEDYWAPKVTLSGPTDVYKYTQLQKTLWGEVRITDSLDHIVVHCRNGKYIYPPEWVKAFNN